MSIVDDHYLTGIPEDGGLTLAFKRYRPKRPNSASTSKRSVRLTLVFTHGVGTRTS